MAPISPLFVAFFTMQFIWLSVYVIKQRIRSGTKLGDGNDTKLRSASAAHNNFAQYVPLMLIILILCELSNVGRLYCTLLGGAMLLGRLSHSYGLIVAEHRPSPSLRFRKIGMMLTFITMGTGAIVLLVKFYA
jgi:uncharacterized membrane protein YecN with MAPEG domain